MANEFPVHALSIAAVLCCVGAPRYALAQPKQADVEAQEKPRYLRLEALGGMGFGDSRLNTGETVNSFGVAASLRAAYAFSFGGNVGLRVDHFFGSSSSYPVPLVALVEHHRRADFMGVDLGFDIHTSHAVFRPYLGLGAMMFSKSVDCTPASGTGFESLAADLCGQSASSEHPIVPAIAPGLSMALILGRLYVILEPRYYYQKETSAFASMAGLGITL